MNDISSENQNNSISLHENTTNTDIDNDKDLSYVEKQQLKKEKLNKKIEPDFIAYRWNNLPNRFVKKNKNIPVIAWTIRSQEEYLKIVKYADNIIFEGFEPQI